MAAPFPHEAVSGRVAPSVVAQGLYGHYAWLARWSDEIGQDVDLDLKKLAQLALVHCRVFSQLLPATVDAPLASAIESRFAVDGVVWPPTGNMVTDLLAIRNMAASLFVFVRDNVPEARRFATRMFDADGRETEVSTTTQKTPTIAREVAKLRALFT